MKKVTVIVPIYNEGNEFKIFLKDLLNSTNELSNPCEIIILDSDTSNNSWEILKKYSKTAKNLKAYLLKHPGSAVEDKTNKYMFGFNVSTGDYVITMDGDGQDRPEELSKFVEALDKGTDFVIGYKQKRRDGYLYMLTSRIANGLIRSLTGVKVHDMNNGFKAFQSNIAKSLNLHSGHFRFIPVIAAAKKWSMDEVKVQHRQREFGEGKFNLISRLQGGLFDMVVVYAISKMGDSPMYTIGWISVTLMLLGFFGLPASLYISSVLSGVLSLLTFFFGLNLFFMGIIIEYLRSTSKNDSGNAIVVETL